MKGIVALFLPGLHTTGKHDHAQYLRNKLLDNGYKVVIFSSFSDLYSKESMIEGEKSIYKLYDKIDMKAAVIYSELIKDDEVCNEITDYCRKRRIPVFSMEHDISGAYNISYDYERSFNKIVDHIIEKHGAKDICLISGIKGNSFSDAREQAYKDSLEEHGLEFDEKNVYYGEFWDEPAKRAAYQLISDRNGRLPDAVVCANDTMAIAVSLVFQEKGYSIPDDVIVTGFDGIDRASIFSPTITTAQPDYKAASDYICSRIASWEKGVPMCAENISFSCQLSKRQSCGCRNIKKNAAGSVYFNLDEMITWQQTYRLHNDHMMLRCMDGRGIESLLESVSQNFAEVVYMPSELYLDPTFFGYTDTKGSGKVLAIQTLGNNTLSMPFTPLEEGRLCSDEILEKSDSLIFVPVHCLERVYGYAVFDYEPKNVVGAWRIYDFTTHLNILLASVETTTQLNETIEQLGVLYIHDQLTELLNRRGFYRELRRLVDRAEKEGKGLMIVSGDLNGLKYINDNFGHNEGDYAISATAKILSDAVGDKGICARFGGDEYMIAMLDDETHDSFEARVYTAVDKLNLKNNKPYDICVSLGCENATVEEARTNVQEVMKLADDKMFAKKIKSRHHR